MYIPITCVQLIAWAWPISCDKQSINSQYARNDNIYIYTVIYTAGEKEKNIERETETDRERDRKRDRETECDRKALAKLREDDLPPTSL